MISAGAVSKSVELGLKYSEEIKSSWTKLLKDTINVDGRGQMNVLRTRGDGNCLFRSITRQELEENAHDAEFDSVLLYRVWLRYLSNMTELDATETINNFSLKADDGMLENARMFISKIASKRNRKLKSGKSHGIVYINGWQ